MQSKQKNLGPALLGVAGVAIVAGLAYYFSSSRPMPDGLIVASGRVEGERIIAAAKYPGRVLKVLAKEGDTLAAGALVAQLEDESFQAKTEQARQVLNATEAQWKSAQASLDVAQKEVPMGLALAEASLSQARAMLSKASAVEQQSQRDAQRHKELFERGVIERHRYEQADLAWQVARTDVHAAEEAVKRATQGVAQANLGNEKIRARQQEVNALGAQRERAAAGVSEAGTVLKDLQITAPDSGVVLSRLREPGEVVMPGGAILEMVNLDRLYLKVYVPESKIGQVKLGLPVRVYTDAAGDKFFDATVSYIAARAEFTPKEVQTTDERTKLVYAVKLRITNNPEHQLTPGIPADAVIRWKQDVAWQKPRWK